MLQEGGAWSGARAPEMLRHIAALHAHPVDPAVLEERLALGECGRTPYRRLSGGQKQRLGLAMALIGRPELVFVDEPTAGLDPEERNRFLNLLAGIGDNVVVILSTHIVDDVADLCPRMAVLANGRLQLEGKPADLVAATRGRIWAKTIDRSELEKYQESHEIISTRLFAGQSVIHALSDKQPAGFEPVEGGLEDVYFSTLSVLRRAA